MAVLIEEFRSKWEKFFARLDSEGVRMYQNFFYYILAVAGAYSLFVADGPPGAVEGAWGASYFVMWCIVGTFGPLVSIAGSKMSGQLAYAGMLCQLTGDTAMSFVLGSFVLAVVLELRWGEGTYGSFAVLAAFLCTVLFIIRDVRRLIQVEKVKGFIE